MDKPELREKILGFIADRCLSNLDSPCDCPSHHREQCWGKVADQILAFFPDKLPKDKPPLLEPPNGTGGQDKYDFWLLGAETQREVDIEFYAGKVSICPECGQYRPDDDRVKNGMKCGQCAY